MTKTRTSAEIEAVTSVYQRLTALEDAWKRIAARIRYEREYAQEHPSARARGAIAALMELLEQEEEKMADHGRDEARRGA